MKTFLPSATFIALSAVSVLMIACGDSGSMQSSNNAQLSDNPTTASATEIPMSATTSAASAFSFVNMMASSQNDSAEPLAGGASVLATSETDEPSV
jgi:hypothetical protein